MKPGKYQIELLQLLAARLERLSADSTWSHRASGLRGNLLKLMDEIALGALVDETRLAALIEQGFTILRDAAMEIPDLEMLKKKR